MLYEADDPKETAAIVGVGRRRFPQDFWFCMMDGRLQAYREQKPDPPAALKSFTAAVAMRPKSVAAHTHLAIALHQTGKPAEAAAELSEVMRLEPTSADNQLSLGYALEQIGKVDAAIDAYRAAIRKRPDDAQSHGYLGTALSQQGKHDEAIAACRESVRLDPDDATPELGLGYVLEQAGKLDDAIASYRAAIRKRPGSARCHSYLASALVQQESSTRPSPRSGKLSGSNRMTSRITSASATPSRCRKSSTRQPPNTERRLKLDGDSADGHFNLASILNEQGKTQEAEAEFAKAKRLSPAISNDKVNLGFEAARAGKMDDAVARFREAIKQKPDDARAHMYLGTALAQERKFDEGIAALREAIRSRPQTPMPTSAWDSPWLCRQGRRGHHRVSRSNPRTA